MIIVRDEFDPKRDRILDGKGELYSILQAPSLFILFRAGVNVSRQKWAIGWRPPVERPGSVP